MYISGQFRQPYNDCHYMVVDSLSIVLYGHKETVFKLDKSEINSEHVFSIYYNHNILGQNVYNWGYLVGL